MKLEKLADVCTKVAISNVKTDSRCWPGIWLGRGNVPECLNEMRVSGKVENLESTKK